MAVKVSVAEGSCVLTSDGGQERSEWELWSSLHGSEETAGHSGVSVLEQTAPTAGLVSVCLRGKEAAWCVQGMGGRALDNVGKVLEMPMGGSQSSCLLIHTPGGTLEG